MNKNKQKILQNTQNTDYPIPSIQLPKRNISCINMHGFSNFRKYSSMNNQLTNMKQTQSMASSRSKSINKCKIDSSKQGLEKKNIQFVNALKKDQNDKGQLKINSFNRMFMKDSLKKSRQNYNILFNKTKQLINTTFNTNNKSIISSEQQPKKESASVQSTIQNKLQKITKTPKQSYLSPPPHLLLSLKNQNIFKYYISQIQKQLNNSSTKTQSQENIFVQHMLLSMCIRKAHKYTYIPKQPIEPKVKINFQECKQELFNRRPNTRNGYEETDTKRRDKKILMFDMDQTLLHGINQLNIGEEENGQDFKYFDQHKICVMSKVNIQKSQKQDNNKYQNFDWEGDQGNFGEFLIKKVSNKDEVQNQKRNKKIVNYKSTIYINIRPFAKEVLKRLSQNFVIGIFTAADQNYADQAIKLLDPLQNIISFRFYRHHCTSISSNLQQVRNTQSQRVKDLRIIQNINMSQIVLIDNSPISYLFQPQNAIPIIPFTNNRDDDQLLKLQSFLHQNILKCEDVRSVLRNQFKIGQYDRHDSVKEVMERLFRKNNKYI